MSKIKFRLPWSVEETEENKTTEETKSKEEKPSKIKELFNSGKDFVSSFFVDESNSKPKSTSGENTELPEEVQDLSKKGELKEKIKEGYKKLENDANELTEDIWSKLEKISEGGNTKVADGINKISDVGNDLLKKGIKKYEELVKEANSMKFEDDLSKNFTEQYFVQAILDKKLKMVYSGERKLYDFLEHTGTKFMWKSQFDYFEFDLIKQNDGRIEYSFKINHIDSKILGIYINHHRIYNVLVKGEDTLDINAGMLSQ